MNSKFQKTIVIKNIAYVVEFVDYCDMITKEAHEEAFGLTDSKKKLIQIRNDLHYNDTRSTIIHEIVHAYIAEYGFDGIVFDEENLCNFMGAYATDIVDMSDDILTEWMSFNGDCDHE